MNVQFATIMSEEPSVFTPVEAWVKEQLMISTASES